MLSILLHWWWGIYNSRPLTKHETIDGFLCTLLYSYQFHPFLFPSQNFPALFWESIYYVWEQTKTTCIRFVLLIAHWERKFYWDDLDINRKHPRASTAPSTWHLKHMFIEPYTVLLCFITICLCFSKATTLSFISLNVVFLFDNDPMFLF